jgi:hypothetical protein
MASQLPIHPQQTTFHLSAILLGNTDITPIHYTDVYIVDFIATMQQPQHMPTLNNLLHAIGSVFSDPPDTNCRAIVSDKKL